MNRPSSAPPAAAPGVGTAFAGVFGLLLALGLMKFGNPVLLDHLVETPGSLEEWRVFAWPLRFAYPLLLIAIGLAVPLIVRRLRLEVPRPLAVLLFAWLACQVAATSVSTDPTLSTRVLVHFIGLVACFLLGAQALSRVAEPRTFWLCLVAGFLVVLGMAADQRFGGLEATRRMILEGAQGRPLPPEYLARIQSNRVFSTLVYPNALAGALLLLLPACGVLLHRFGAFRWGPGAARILATAMTAAGLAVLVWSGSKAGWLIAMGLILTVLFLSPLSRKFRIALGIGVCVVGLGGFAWVFAAKLKGGATSVSARFDYWQAAVTGIAERPLLGHGPGGFKRVYARVKRPESEMAQLAHNDYLQQGVDSGIAGFLAYAAFVLGSLGTLARRHARANDRLVQAVALGLIGWFAHGMVEFGLYIPATSWCAFALLGWALAQKPSPAVTASVTSR